MAENRDILSVLGEARSGTWEPAYAFVGAERFLSERAAALLKRAVLGDDGVRGFNDDVFNGQGLSGTRVTSSARTLPMMSRARFILLRDADAMATAEQEPLAEYLAAPSPTTCLVLIAEKLDGKTKLAKAAKKAGVWIDVSPLKPPMLGRFARAEAKRRNNPMDADAEALLVDAIGNDLAALDDAVERLSLYVGAGQPIDPAAVEGGVTRVRVDSVWAVVDAVAGRRTKVALSGVATLLADREPALRILSLVARQIRMVARFKHAIAEGMRGTDATRAAGAPPFKARDLEQSARRFEDAELRRCLHILGEADVALKGSRRPDETVLEETILALCEGRALPLLSQAQLRE